MPFREKDLDLEKLLWNKEAHSLAPLLAVSSEADASDEPRWLVFCDYLASAFRQGESAKASMSWDQKTLQELTDQVWGPEAMSADDLVHAWFALPDVEEGQPHHWFACRETAHRAVAIAELAGRRYGWRNEGINPDAWLSAQEQKALKLFWANSCGPEVSLRMPVLLLNESAAVGEKGRRAQLRFHAVKVEPAFHGQLFRAPGAAMLTLQDRGNTTFVQGLEKVTTLLKACLKPAESGEQGEQGGQALMWSLHPEPMAVDRDAGAALQAWGSQPITGPSATGAFAIGALWVLRKDLRLDLPGFALALKQLRAIHPGHLAISAQLEGLAPPDLNSPLKWRLAPVGGLDEKLGTFVLDRQLQTKYQRTVSLALVAKGQNCKGDEDEGGVELKPAEDLAQALEFAYGKVGAPLPEAGEALWRYLLDQSPEEADGQSDGVPQVQPATPIAPRELIDPLRAEFERSSQQGPAGITMASDRGKPNAIAWYLLKSYARWAGGDHVLWGEPARLAEDFYPIELETIAEAGAPGKEAEDSHPKGKLRARSLIELLDPVFLPQQPPVWVLGAPPAAGKTTMLAEFHLFHSYKALRQYASSGHFGVVPVWIPARELVLKDPENGSDRSLDQALAAWFQSSLPALGGLPDLLRSHLARVQILLDGINELRCEPSRRATLLADWLAAHFGPAHGHRPPLLTVRSLELIRPQGARVANLLPWDKGQRDAYVRQRLAASPDYLAAMQASLDADEKAAGESTEKMLYSSPGMLSLACTLMANGLLPPDPQQRPMNRARLLATLIWSRLEAEDQGHNRSIPAHFLGEEEIDRLSDLQDMLRDGDWLPPENPGPLLAALGEQARHMQFDQASAQIELPESQWWRSTEDAQQRSALTAAASHLGVVQRRRAEDASGRKRYWVGYRHQLLLEWFAAFGLTPDGPWPRGVAAPEMKPLEKDYEDWERLKEDWEYERDARSYSELDAEAVDKDLQDDAENQAEDFPPFFPPDPAVSVHEETIKLAMQLRGGAATWVSRLLNEGNTSLAARLALNNWAAFGEPEYPKNRLGPWLPERMDGEEIGTHPVLNRLRDALHIRMYGPEVHLSQRIEAGDLLGQIGGSPLLRICGQALVLKEENWAQIGEPGKDIEFEMGDFPGELINFALRDLLDIPIWRAPDDRLYKVRDLPAFRMAGVLVTNAQYRCFSQSTTYGDAVWWPGEAGRWWAQERHEMLRYAWSLRNGVGEDGYGLAPVRCNFWMAQAYGLWESAQRRAEGEIGDSIVVRAPSEAEWEGGARWAAYGQDRSGQSGPGRWRFAHTKGEEQHPQGSLDDLEVGYANIRPWSFNHGQIYGGRTTPVGVYLDSNAFVGKTALSDLAGNVGEWTISAYEEHLSSRSSQEAQRDEKRAVRGGDLTGDVGYCRVGRRDGWATNNFDGSIGLRLVLAVAL